MLHDTKTALTLCANTEKQQMEEAKQRSEKMGKLLLNTQMLQSVNQVRFSLYQVHGMQYNIV